MIIGKGNYGNVYECFDDENPTVKLVVKKIDIE
jgi:hypothetical protein